MYVRFAWSTSATFAVIWYVSMTTPPGTPRWVLASRVAVAAVPPSPEESVEQEVQTSTATGTRDRTINLDVFVFIVFARVQLSRVSHPEALRPFQLVVLPEEGSWLLDLGPTLVTPGESETPSSCGVGGREDDHWGWRNAVAAFRQ